MYWLVDTTKNMTLFNRKIEKKMTAFNFITDDDCSIKLLQCYAYIMHEHCTLCNEITMAIII
ncbi:hypothetical protein T01_3908 [Trichinella spiralis]|uniref:Uncharacterized protein n=1 Tax=Trichinella spiralis TaxID=6334 RepID=A0A0V1C0E0_TRISP|nr:hypothetical protein T01_3908 [Trichinella spiralis]